MLRWHGREVGVIHGLSEVIKVRRFTIVYCGIHFLGLFDTVEDKIYGADVLTSSSSFVILGLREWLSIRRYVVISQLRGVWEKVRWLSA
jgi:hypothetical protein